MKDMVFDLILVHFFLFQISIGSKNATILRVANSSLVKIDNKKKDVSVLGKGLTQGLDDTIIAEAEYSINSSRLEKIIMEATVFYLIMLKKYINSKQKTLK